ncbi:MAG: cysteine synthase family protein [Lachnospiraceae bacterium]|nr:cysteine synthase family protein [Lachnospiraceae bacterium]
MGYYGSMQELIGHTPLVKLNNIGAPEGVGIFAKLELWNPSGSVKDRTGAYMLKAAEESGILKPGGTIVMGTAGNTGMGVAFAALNKGYRIIFAIPTKFSEEKQALVRALGAEIVNTPREDGMIGAGKKAEEIKQSIPGAVLLDQFTDKSNPQAHYETTGREIYEDLDGQVDYLVAGAGSGGTFSGVVKYLKEKKPDVKGILADPVGSILGGGEHGDYDIEGIGAEFYADTFNVTLMDEAIKINDDEAFSTSVLLAKREGIFAGSSSGAAVAAALKLAGKIKSGNIVAILPDRGDRYFSSGLYDEKN